jgi:hypothetical protein
VKTWLAHLPAWLAQTDFGPTGRRLRPAPEPVDPTTLALFACSLLALLALVLLVGRWVAARRAHGYYSERGLFRELCRAHGLDWASARLLRRLAAYHRLPQPAQLFLDPSYFQADRLDGALRECGERISRIGQVIFAPAPSSE